MALIEFYSNEELSNKNFNQHASELAEIFRRTPSITSYNFIGIDPHPQEDGTVKVFYEYEIEIEPQS